MYSSNACKTPQIPLPSSALSLENSCWGPTLKRPWLKNKRPAFFYGTAFCIQMAEDRQMCICTSRAYTGHNHGVRMRACACARVRVRVRVRVVRLCVCLGVCVATSSFQLPRTGRRWLNRGKAAQSSIYRTPASQTWH